MSFPTPPYCQNLLLHHIINFIGAKIKIKVISYIFLEDFNKLWIWTTEQKVKSFIKNFFSKRGIKEIAPRKIAPHEIFYEFFLISNFYFMEIFVC